MDRIIPSIVFLCAGLTGCVNLSGDARVAGASPVCVACRVTITHELDLKAAGVLNPPARVLKYQSGYYVAPTIERWQVARFTADGRLTELIGKRGGGPGEHLEVRGIASDSAGNLWVHHDFNRITVYDSQTSSTRSFTLGSDRFIPGRSVVLPDGRIVALRAGSVPGATDFPVRVFDAAGNSVDAWADADDDIARYRAATVTGETVWVLEQTPLRLDEFDTAGTLRSSWNQLHWYPEGPSGRSVRMADIGASSDGNLWILGVLPRSNTGAPEKAPAPHPVERQLSTSEVTRRDEYVLDLVDPRAKVLVARASLGDHVAGGFVDTDTLYTVTEDARGEVIIRIWRLGIRRPHASQATDPRYNVSVATDAQTRRSNAAG